LFENRDKLKHSIAKNTSRTDSSESKIPEILFVWDYLEWGGVQIYFFALMQAASEKFRVRAVLPEKSAHRLFDDLAKINVPYLAFPAHTDVSAAQTIRRRIERRINKARSERILLKYLNRENLQDCILQLDLSPFHSFLTIYLLARKSRIVQTFHTPLPAPTGWRGFEQRTKFKILTGLPNYRLLASNELAKESLRPFVSAEVFEKIKVAYSGITRSEIDAVLADKPTREQIAAKYDLPLQKFWVFSVGQFIERKGCWTFLEAAQQMKAENITFVWFGTTAPNAETLRRIEEYNLGDSFRLFSPADFGGERKELLTLISHADVFVLASLLEGLPIALVEAMALRRAPIATPVGAIPEAIENERTGFLLEVGNAAMLVELIRRLKQNETLRETVAAAAQALAFEKFDQAKASQTTIEVYEELKRGNFVNAR